MKKNNMAKTAFAIFKGELAMIPALIMCIYNALDRAWWDVNEFDHIVGGELVDAYHRLTMGYIEQNCQILAVLALVVAIIAAAVALHKGKAE